MDEEEFLYMLKHGRSDEVQQAFLNLQKNEYSEDFTMFMDEMIREHRIKRKDIAIRSGMSQDYTYKLLRGDKKTNERDYILAICIAIGMNFAQVQHALKIYGMQPLHRADLRSHVISLGIGDNLDIDGINDWLEKSGFNLLRTSPDMPSSPITPIDTESEPVKSQQIHHLVSEYEEIDRSIEAERCGPAPMDYMYTGTIRLRDEEGKEYIVEAVYDFDGDHFSVMTAEMQDQYNALVREHNTPMQKFMEKYGDILNNPEAKPSEEELGQVLAELTEIEDFAPLEQYESLVDAASSPFFSWFLKLDRDTDDKVAKTLRAVNDTRYSGTRCGMNMQHCEWKYYVEAFNTNNPELQEYFQIVEIPGKGCTFTVSHESCYMRMELGEIYPTYFGVPDREMEYFINVKDLDELQDEKLHYKYIFKDLLLFMHMYLRETYGVEIPEETILDEQIENKVNFGTYCMNTSEIDEAERYLAEAYELMKKRGIREKTDLTLMISTARKLAAIASEKEDEAAAYNWNTECLSYKEALEKVLEEADDETIDEAATSLATACDQMAMYAFQKGNNERGMECLTDAIRFFTGRCHDEFDWRRLANCLVGYAYRIDNDDPEKSLEYTGKALDIIRDHALERQCWNHNLTVVALNNHAWVLWNRLSSEEAIIYYGRCIDLIEGYLAGTTPDPDRMREELEKEIYALYGIYKATGKEKEANRLKKRYALKGIEIPED